MGVELEKYRSIKSRYTCPSCNQQNCFSRYITDEGNHLSEEVGRCNRETKCGYHYKPKEYFADNPTMFIGLSERYTKAKKRNKSKYSFTNANDSYDIYKRTIVPEKLDFISFEQFIVTLDNYDQNAFAQFLLNLFPDCADEVQDALKMYFVGTYEDYTCFPYIDRLNRICKAKLIRFNQTTGKRLKGEYDTSSLVKKLKLKEDFKYKQIFFGEHLLTKYPDKTVAIVEAEKTAVIASVCFPEFIWLGSNSKSWLKYERLKSLENRQIILYPDADGFNLWQEKAKVAQRLGSTIKVSSLIENHATDEQKANGYDLADYLINQQTEINKTNDYVDRYNAKLEIVLNDEKLKQNFETILNEQKVTALNDGKLSEEEAELRITDAENIRKVILSL